MLEDIGSPSSLDLYREMHKGLRSALFHLCAAAGSLDASDMEARRALAAQFAEVDRLLTLHHRHENEGALGHLIATVCPEFLAELQARHTKTVEDLTALRILVTALSHGHHIAGELYDRITALLTDYLGHMAFEERDLMPALSARATFESLIGAEIDVRSAIAPTDMLLFLRWMLPAMNADERLNMLGLMQITAPPGIFDTYWAIATYVLRKDQVAFLAERLGISTLNS
jgi:hypothetical protein